MLSFKSLRERDYRQERTLETILHSSRVIKLFSRREQLSSLRVLDKFELAGLDWRA